MIYSDNSVAFIHTDYNLSPEDYLVVKRSSTTSLDERYLVFSRKKVMSHAKEVVKYLNVYHHHWLCILPISHIAGLMVHARAEVSEGSYSELKKWNVNSFFQEIQKYNNVICSIVPTQLYDLIKTDQFPPKNLKLLIVGGDYLSDKLKAKAISLGYPLVFSYGMSEACSTVALAENEGFTRIPGQEISVEDEIIYIKSDYSYDFEINQTKKNIKENKNSNIKTSDHGEIKGTQLFFKGRCSDVVVINGFNYNLKSLQSEFSKFFPKQIHVYLMAIKSERKGHKLVLFYESESKLSPEINFSIKPDQLIRVDQFSRTSLGKIRIEELKMLI